MKRLLIIPIVLFLLLSSGCEGIDWKVEAKKAFATLIEHTMTIAVAEFGDKKMEAIDWTVEYIEGVGWASNVIKWIPYESIIEYAYDEIWDAWDGMLRDADYDTDAFENYDSKVFMLMDAGMTVPGLQDALFDMME